MASFVALSSATPSLTQGSLFFIPTGEPISSQTLPASSPITFSTVPRAPTSSSIQETPVPTGGTEAPSIGVFTSSQSPTPSNVPPSSSVISSESSGDRTSSSVQSATSSPNPSPSRDPSPSLSAGAGAGIAIGVLTVLLAVLGGIVLFVRRRRRRRRAGAEEGHPKEKPQLDDTSVVPPFQSHSISRTPLIERQELEGSSAPATPTNHIPAELRAGPYSNRHELEHRNR